MKTFPTTTKITTILNNKFLLTSISWCKHYSVVSMSLKNDQCLWTPCLSCYSWSLAMLVKKLFSPYFSIQPPFSKTFYFSQLSKPDWNLTFVLKEFPLSFGQAKIYSCLFQTWVMSTLCFPLPTMDFLHSSSVQMCAPFTAPLSPLSSRTSRGTVSFLGHLLALLSLQEPLFHLFFWR